MITLYSESRNDIKIHITARINHAGELLIEGIDSGPLVNKLHGDSDYEYYLTVKKPNKELLIEHLKKEGNNVTNDTELLDWLKTHFCDNQAFSSLTKYLQKEKIEFESFFW